MGLFMNAAQTGFVARKQSRGAGLVGQRAEGGGENHAGIDGGEFLLELGLLGDHFGIDEGDFDGQGAEDGANGQRSSRRPGPAPPEHGVILAAHFVELALILTRKEEGVVSGAAVAERIARGFFLPLGGLGTMGLGAVDTGAFGLSCRHKQTPGQECKPRENGKRLLFPVYY